MNDLFYRNLKWGGILPNNNNPIRIFANHTIIHEKYGDILTFIIFIPTLIRTILKTCLYKVSGNKKFLKYKYRLDGLLKSITNKKSNLRP